MKRIIIFSLIFVFAGSVALAIGAQNGAGSPSASPSHSPSPSLSASPSHSPSPSLSGTPKMEQFDDQNDDQEEQDDNQGKQVQNEQQTQNEGEESELKNKESIGEIDKEEHRSTVANFVQNLLGIADKESGIGEQIRTIAQEQNQIQEKISSGIDVIQTRSKVKTFFFGTDYKNLGEMRSEMVKVQNQIEQLTQLQSEIQNEYNKVVMEEQLQVLEQEQTRIESFINTNESKFSLFGWLVKIFAK